STAGPCRDPGGADPTRSLGDGRRSVGTAAGGIRSGSDRTGSRRAADDTCRAQSRRPALPGVRRRRLHAATASPPDPAAIDGASRRIPVGAGDRAATGRCARQPGYPSDATFSSATTMRSNGRSFQGAQIRASLARRNMLTGSSLAACGASRVEVTHDTGRRRTYLPVFCHVCRAWSNEVWTSFNVAPFGNIIRAKLAGVLVSFRTSIANVPGAGVVSPSYRQPSPLNVARMTASSLESLLHPTESPTVARVTNDRATYLRSIAAVSVCRAARRWKVRVFRRQPSHQQPREPGARDGRAGPRVLTSGVQGPVLLFSSRVATSKPTPTFRTISNRSVRSMTRSISGSA